VVLVKNMTHKSPLIIRLCGPRGFCAGVDRAIQIVIAALKKYGAPVYVRHEIVHNGYVVEGLRQRGAVFIEELDEIAPEDSDRPVIFSAHGVPKSVPAAAEKRHLFYLDATCPLVSKVHKQALRHHRQGRHVVLIGHAGHPEVIGTMGQLETGAVSLVETVEQVQNYQPDDPAQLGFVTQTTLSVEDTTDIIAALQVLTALRRRGKTLAQLLEPLVLYPQIMVNVPLAPGFHWQEHAGLQAAIRAVEQDLGDQGRVLVRASGTEPKLRLMVEAQTEALAQQGIAQLRTIDLSSG